MVVKTSALFMSGLIGVSTATPLVAVALGSLPEHVPMVALSGFFGGVARWMWDETKFWPYGTRTVTVGMIAAVFLWPVAGPMVASVIGSLEMEPVTELMFSGFLTGLFGVSLIGGALDVFKARKKRLEGSNDSGV